MLKKIIAPALLLSLVSGCASVMTQNSKTVEVSTSNSEQIQVSVDNANYQVPGPITLVKDGKNKTLSTDAEGCDDAVATRKVEPAFFGNVLIGGLVGSTTDAVGAKMWTYDDSIVINCR